MSSHGKLNYEQSFPSHKQKKIQRKKIDVSTSQGALDALQGLYE